MSEKEKSGNDREKTMEGYKEKILPVNKASLTLKRDLYFIGQTQRGYEVEYDPRYEEGCSPTETLLLSLAGCLAIDMVSILRKMRCEIKSFRMETEGERKLSPPQFYKSMEIMIFLSGEGLTHQRIDRAIALSRDKYCSVLHSLRNDLDLVIRYEIT